jgi:hypothetical protein
MGASTSQHTTSIDFGRRCVAYAEARPPPASKLDAGAVTTMTTAEIAVAFGDARRRAEASSAPPEAHIRDQELPRLS